MRKPAWVRRTLTAVAVSAGLVVGGGVIGGGSPAFAATGLTVDPSSGLTHGQSVTISASGFVPGHEVYVVECAAEGHICNGSDVRKLTVDADGGLQVSMPAYKTFVGVGDEGDVDVDCAATPCVFAAFDAATEEFAMAAISFS